MRSKMISADEISIHDLLNNKNEVYCIPIYQRPYEWTKDQWEYLWEDIMQLEEDNIHFLGSIVVVNDTHRKSFNYCEVVDGQQRITSIMIILTAIRDLYLENNNENNANYITDNYLFSSTFDERKPKLKLGKDDDKIFELLLNRMPIPNDLKNSKVYLAYNYFKERVSNNITDIKFITNKFLYSVNLVLIGTQSYYDAFRLFETLNNRGLALSAVDLIKNYLLSKIASNNVILNRGIELWNNLIRNLNNEQIDKVKFFRHYLFSTENGVVSNTQLYSKYQDVIDNSNNVIEYLEDIFDKSNIYRNIIECSFDSKKVNSLISAINRIEASTSYPLLLKLFSEENISENTIIIILQAIEIFALRRSVCNTTTRDLDRIYNHLAMNAFDKSNPAEYVVEYLKEKTPSDEEFYHSFKERDFVRDDQTKYILEKIEDFITNSTKEKIISDRKDVHIEHIMPVEIISKKYKKIYGDWENYLGEDAIKHKSYVNKIGNLTLLGSGLNITASNNPFEAKREIYSTSNIKLTKEICNYGEWKINQIIERSDKLAKLSVGIWNYARII